MSPKIFIFYTSREHALAQRLYEDLTGRGAGVFLFEQDSDACSDSLSRDMGTIKERDFFVLLLAQVTLKAESSQRAITTVRKDRPSLVQAQTKDPNKPPALTIHTDLPFEHYETGFKTLVELLPLAQESSAIEDDAARRGSPASPSPAQSPLSVSLTADPVTTTVQTKVSWTCLIRNDGTGPIDGIVTRLGETPLAPPFTLAPGAQREFHRDAIFAEPGPRTRTLSAEGQEKGGTTVAAQASAKISVGPPTAESSTPDMRSEREPEDEAIRALFRADGEIIDGPAATQPTLHERKSLWVFIVLVIGVLTTLIAYLLDGWLLSKLPDKLPIVVEATLLLVDETQSVMWTLLILAPLIIGYGASSICETLFVTAVEGWEYALIALLASIIAFVALQFPGFLLIRALTEAQIGLFVTAGVGVAGAVSIYRAIAEM